MTENNENNENNNDDDGEPLLDRNEVIKILLKYKNEPIDDVVARLSPLMPFTDQVVKAMIIDLMNTEPQIVFKNKKGEKIESKKSIFSRNKKEKKEPPHPYPTPFIPDLADLINERQDWNKLASQQSNRNFKIRIARVSFAVGSPCIFLIIATYHLFPLNQVIGAALLVMFTCYFSMVLFFAFSVGSLFTTNKEKKKDIADDKLYRIYSISKKPDDWADINTGYLQLQYHNKSIQSISELSAINGGVTKVMLNTIGAYTWCAVGIHFAGQLYFNRCIFSWDRADLCELFGVIGLLLISIFELDPFNKWMIAFHYIGAAFGTGTIAGFVLQCDSLNPQDHLLWFALTVGVIAAISFVLWQLTGVATDMSEKKRFSAEYGEKMKKEGASDEEIEEATNEIMSGGSCLQCLIPKWATNYNVNGYSKANIGFEALFLYLGSLCLCLYLINYDKNCEIGCAGVTDYSQISPKSETGCYNPQPEYPNVFCSDTWCYVANV